MKPVYRNEEENLAAAYLRRSGFTVLARNDRRFGAEFDFLCSRGAPDEFFIFEIKKKPRLRSAAYPRISAAQLKRLRKAAVKMQAAAGKFLTVRISLLVVDKKSSAIEIIADI